MFREKYVEKVYKKLVPDFYLVLVNLPKLRNSRNYFVNNIL